MTSFIKASSVSAFRMCRILRNFLLGVCVLAFAFFSACLSLGEALAKTEKLVIHAGYRTLSSSLPSERLMLHMGVWYPTKRRPVTVKAEAWTFRAARNAPVLDGKWPVILLSHDVTGDAWAHHEIAADLARRGFIVAAPTHDNDNAEDMRMLFSDRELPIRALQIRAALDVLLENSHIGPHADAARVGFLGFGLTAPAGLLLAGGTLDPGGWELFIKDAEKHSLPAAGASTPPPASNRDEAKAVSPWLSPFSVQCMDDLVASMKHRAEERKLKTIMMERATAARIQVFDKQNEAMKRTHQRQLRLSRVGDIPQPPAVLPLLPPLSHDKTVEDVRFKAVALISPGYSMLFSPSSLANVTCPVLVAGAEKDRYLRPTKQADRIASMLPEKASAVLFTEASSSDFQSRSPAGDAARLLEARDIDRHPLHFHNIRTRLVLTLQDFFGKALG